MDALATVLLRRAGAVPLPQPATSANGQSTNEQSANAHTTNAQSTNAHGTDVQSAYGRSGDGDAWVEALEADLAGRGWLLAPSLRQRFAELDPGTRLRWADWVAAIADESTGADRDHVPLFRNFPDTPENPRRLYVERLLVHLFQHESAPCVICGTARHVRPLDPCAHVVCTACFDPERYTACPICGRRLTGGAGTYLPVVAPAGAAAHQPAVRLRRLYLELDPAACATRLRDDLVARPAALGASDREDLGTLVAATAPGRLDWLPDVVPARETLACVIAWALPAAALEPSYPDVLADAARRWGTATDVARALWAYSGGDPGLIVPRRTAESNGPNEGWRPVHEPRVTVAIPRVRALPRALRRAVLGVIDGLDCATAAEDVARHPVVWKRLAERLHPFEHAATHPRAAVVFAALRGTRAAAGTPLGRAMAAAHHGRPDRILRTEHPDGTVSVRARTFAAVVEQAVANGDATAAAQLLTERPGDLWRRLDHLLRLAGDDPDALSRVLDAAARTTPRVSPGVLAAAAAELTGRDATVPAVTAAEAAEQAAAEVAAQAAAAAAPGAAGGIAGRDATVPGVTAEQAAAGIAGQVAAVPAEQVGGLGTALRRALGLRPAPAPAPPRRTRPTLPGPAPGTPRRTFFPKGDVVRTWTEPERRGPLPAAAIARIRSTVDGELAGRAAGLDGFDVAVLDASLARVPAPGRERAGSEQLAGWPRGSVRPLGDAPILRLFLHWVDAGKHRVDLDLSCAFYAADWTSRGHCDYTHLRYKGNAAVHSGDLTSAPPPLGATEYLDLDRAALRDAGVAWAVPVVLSYNDVPFEALDAAFSGLSLPQDRHEPFAAARVLQRFTLRGDAKALAPFVLDVDSGAAMWVDASLSAGGYGHNVGQRGPRLGRMAADLWEHFTAGNRPTLLDLAAWHAAGRAKRVVVVHADGTGSELPAGAPHEIVAAVRAADCGGTPAAVSPGAKTFACAADPDRLAAIVGADVAEGSAALLVDGTAPAPWTPITAADLLSGLTPSV
ncbi:MXAN_6230/SCO0854 family RING domain-containing protein [Dactylosporangium sp. NPDC051541]|uniref:MXAN_6230/SCO0854 family RING domain-containing protein n=1 Tax=Dactylosporangium sp. NPDC051541 TaxID=3363977 RepID=UPI0037AD5014